MRDINIGAVIANKRKEKGITQEELAEFIGVSKAAVSKWETDQSYPDIVLLPGLASYFNLSIDELLGYIPQMSIADVKNTYLQLIGEFAKAPFNETIEKCRALTIKYYSCFPLLFRIALLYINHHMLAKDREEGNKLLIEARGLLSRVKRESGDVRLSATANSLEAACYMMLGEPDKMLSLLDVSLEPEPEQEGMLAAAYTMKGNTSRAKEILQISAYKHIVALAAMVPQYLSLIQGERDRFSEALRRAEEMIAAYNLDKLHPNSAMQIYYTAASVFASWEDTAAAMEMLKKYAFALENLLPFKLKGDEYFDLIDGWLNGLECGESAPRQGKIVLDSVLASLSTPQFDKLKKDPAFCRIYERVKELKISYE